MLKVTQEIAQAFGWSWCKCKKGKIVVNAYMAECICSNLFNWMSDDKEIVELLQPLSDETRYGSMIYIDSLKIYKAGIKLLKKAGYKISNQHPPRGRGELNPDVIY